MQPPFHDVAQIKHEAVHRVSHDPGMQVPTPWSLLGAGLILSSTLMLGVFERKKDIEVKEHVIASRRSGRLQVLGSRGMS